MLLIEYDPHAGTTVPDAQVHDFVQNTICEYLLGFMSWIKVGQESIINEFRLAIVNGDVQCDDIAFIQDGHKHTPNKFGVIAPWPPGFCQYDTDRCMAIISNASKIRKADAQQRTLQ